jgi:1,4-dihydroxy-2-naphthoate octaprenyltransferase
MKKEQGRRRESLVFVCGIVGLSLAFLYSSAHFETRALRLLLGCFGIALFSFSGFMTSVFEYKRFGSIESRSGVIKPDQVRAHLLTYFIAGCISTALLTGVAIARLFNF